MTGAVLVASSDGVVVVVGWKKVGVKVIGVRVSTSVERITGCWSGS
jgi:hypothetical protein